MPRKDSDSEAQAFDEVVEQIRMESAYADAAETLANCWKLREWQTRVLANPDNTMLDFALWVYESIEAGSWDAEWNAILFRLYGTDMSPRIRQYLIDHMPVWQIADWICRGRGGEWFKVPELKQIKPRLDGVFMAHPGRHYIDEI